MSLHMMICNVAGKGGGSGAVPMLMYFFNLSFKQAVGISAFLIVTTSFTRFFFNFNERHPEKPNCCEIDHNMVAIMIPLTLLGSLIGSFVYKSFPEALLISVLIFLQFYMLFDSHKKYKKQCEKEDKEEKERAKKRDEEESVKLLKAENEAANPEDTSDTNIKTESKDSESHQDSE